MRFRELSVGSLGLVAAFLLGTTAEASLLRGSTGVLPCNPHLDDCNKGCVDTTTLQPKQCDPCPNGDDGWLCLPTTPVPAAVAAEAAPAPLGTICFQPQKWYDCIMRCHGHGCVHCPDQGREKLWACPSATVPALSAGVVQGAPALRGIFCFRPREKHECVTKCKHGCVPCPLPGREHFFACAPATSSPSAGVVQAAPALRGASCQPNFDECNDMCLNYRASCHPCTEKGKTGWICSVAGVHGSSTAVAKAAPEPLGTCFRTERYCDIVCESGCIPCPTPGKGFLFTCRTTAAPSPSAGVLEAAPALRVNTCYKPLRKDECDLRCKRECVPCTKPGSAGWWTCPTPAAPAPSAAVVEAGRASPGTPCFRNQRYCYIVCEADCVPCPDQGYESLWACRTIPAVSPSTAVVEAAPALRGPSCMPNIDQCDEICVMFFNMDCIPCPEPGTSGSWICPGSDGSTTAVGRAAPSPLGNPCYKPVRKHDCDVRCKQECVPCTKPGRAGWWTCPTPAAPAPSAAVVEAASASPGPSCMPNIDQCDEICVMFFNMDCIPCPEPGTSGSWICPGSDGSTTAVGRAAPSPLGNPCFKPVRKHDCDVRCKQECVPCTKPGRAGWWTCPTTSVPVPSATVVEVAPGLPDHPCLENQGLCDLLCTGRVNKDCIPCPTREGEWICPDIPWPLDGTSTVNSVHRQQLKDDPKLISHLNVAEAAPAPRLEKP
eukprot:RCo021767